MAWLFNESAALKRKLSTLTVSDINAPETGRPVNVKFNLSESEISDQTFPLVVIDYVGLTRAPEREHRGKIALPYVPEGYPNWWEDPNPLERRAPVQDFPVPYDLDYQVTVHSRKSSHDLSLIGALAHVEYLPTRFGYLEVPEDNTVRSLDLMDGPEPLHSEDGAGKRLLRQVYRVRIATEMTPTYVARASALVTRVNIEFEDIDTGAPLLVTA